MVSDVRRRLLSSGASHVGVTWFGRAMDVCGEWNVTEA